MVLTESESSAILVEAMKNRTSGESESNAILVEAMKSRTSGEMIRAYQVLVN